MPKIIADIPGAFDAVVALLVGQALTSTHSLQTDAGNAIGLAGRSLSVIPVVQISPPGAYTIVTKGVRAWVIDAVVADLSLQFP
jgi:hypothetical protein